MTDGTTTLWSATYDSAGRKVSETDANGRTVQYVYDAIDRMTSYSRTLNGQQVAVSFLYDADSNRVKLTDPMAIHGNGWVWMGWSEYPKISIHSPPQTLRRESCTTPMTSAVISLRKPIDWASNRCSATTLPTGPRKQSTSSLMARRKSTVTYTYDFTTHRLTEVSDTKAPGSGIWSWTYDSLDRPISQASPYGTLTFAMNPMIHRREGLTASGQNPITYGFDNNDNVTSTIQSGLTTTIVYDALNRRTRSRHRAMGSSRRGRTTAMASCPRCLLTMAV